MMHYAKTQALRRKAERGKVGEEASFDAVDQGELTNPVRAATTHRRWPRVEKHDYLRVSAKWRVVVCEKTERLTGRRWPDRICEFLAQLSRGRLGRADTRANTTSPSHRFRENDWFLRGGEL